MLSKDYINPHLLITYGLRTMLFWGGVAPPPPPPLHKSWIACCCKGVFGLSLNPRLRFQILYGNEVWGLLSWIVLTFFIKILEKHT